MKKEKCGFSPQDEEKFLKRLPQKVREVNLGQELKTQLAEDFGLVKFTLKYKFDSGVITDLNSGQRVVELTGRGEVEEETESIRKIEEGLKEHPEKTWIHFSPKNDKLNYIENCVDFWRVVNDGVVWNRIVVKNSFEEMNKVRSVLGEEFGTKNEMDMLKSPLATNLKLAEVFSLFSLSESRYTNDFEYIEKTVNQHLSKFKKEFGDEIANDSDLILRLYSACHDFLKYNRNEEMIISRSDLEIFMYGKMQGMVEEKSFGCSGITTVGSFGERVGYYVTAEGKVQWGSIPKECNTCEKCGLPYLGEKCPFC